VIVWAVDDLELEIAKEFGPTDLALIKTFGYDEIPKVFIVGDHFNKFFVF